jgi:o-succinylbenzoate---CoA ligase
MMLVRAFLAAFDVTIAEPDGNPLKNWDARTSFTAFVPLQVSTLRNEFTNPPVELNGLKAIIIGGAPLQSPEKTFLQKMDSPCFATYGMTETVSHVALQRINGTDPDEYFYPLPEVEIKTNRSGCLWIRGIVTGNEWLETNDLAEIHQDGGFSILGRTDNIINSGGKKIQLEKIEHKLHSFLNGSGITDFAACSMRDDLLGEKLVLVVSKEHPVISVSKLKIANTGLDKYEIPKEIIVIDQIPKTRTGKTNYKELKEILNTKFS